MHTKIAILDSSKNIKMKVLYTILILTLYLSLFSQRGKDGTVTINTANTIVNQYTGLTANVSSGTKTLTVANSSLFNIGDLVYIIQMQGANVNSYHGGFTPPWYDSQSALPTDTSFGRIINYNNCGLNEFAQVNSIPNGTSLVLDCDLTNSYNAYNVSTINTGSGTYTVNLLGNVQVIKVPRYSSLTINGAGSITCPQWNGSTGGIAIVEVENNTVLNSTPSFNVSGKGFRGGIKDNAASVFGGDKFGANNPNQGGYKGESIAGDSSLYKFYASLTGRGGIANGGGGGCAHNAGGGGGANGGVPTNYRAYGNPDISVTTYTAIWDRESAGFSSMTSSGGGRGGYSFSNSNVTLNSSSNPPGSTNWGGDNRRNTGGFGGRPLNYSTGRLFIGGGGGAGDGNENKAGAGGNGGGMVYIVTYGDLSGSGTIVADGANGSNSAGGCSTNDAAGGGGGGGTIILNTSGTTNLTATTALSAKGGNGGNVVFNCVLSNSDGYGPGAGGGGGYITTSGAVPTNTIAGGNNGIQTGNSSNISTTFPPNGATKGGVGGTGSISNYTLTASSNQTVCANQIFTVTASSTQPSSTINWYNGITGGAVVASGTTYTNSYSTPGTYTIYAGECPGTYRQPIIITVNSGLTISINSPTICPNQSAVLTATTTAATFTWSTGANTSSVSVSPTVTTVYTLNATEASCVGTKTTQVTVASVPSLTVANVSICSNNSATLTASGATNYTWAPGGQTTSNIVVTPSISTTYTITGTNGTCTNSTTASVNVTNTPTLTTSPTTICAGQVATFTVSGATNYTWTPGNVTGSTFTLNPSSSTSVSVLGANGSCTALATTSLTVNQNPTITVNNPSICSGQTATLTASNATTYTWSTSSNSNSISVSPTNTTSYTVSGTSNGCSSSTVATVSVIALPTLTISGNSPICSGTTSTLTVNGTATNYTWMPSGQTATSITVSPTSTTNYTLTGINGTCTNTTSATLSVTTTPTLSAPSATICSGQTATLTVSGATTYTWNPGNVTGDTYNIAPSSNTVVSVIGANGTCTAQTSVSITIGSAVSISVPDATICPGMSATLTASPVDSYTWTTGSNTNTTVVSPTVTTTYTVYGTQGTCTGNGTVAVTVIPQPTLAVSNSSICSGNSGTLTVIGSATTYSWMPVGQTTTTIVVTPTTNTTYSITGSNGVCSNSTTATVSVTSTPTLSTNSATICPGGIATLTVSGANTYTWTPGNITGNTYTLSTGSSTTVDVIGENNGCTSQTTAIVNVNSNPPISVTDQTICFGQTATLTAGGATTYTWSTGSNSSSITATPTVNTTYTVTGTVGSCIGTNTVMVSVTSLPTISVTGNSPICSGNTATLTANGATNYTWMPSGQISASITDNPNTTTTYTLTGFDGTCTNTTTTTLSVTATPTIIANPVSICTGQTATLTASGADSFTWTPGNTTGSSYTITTASSTTVSILGATGTCTSQITTSVTVGSALSIAVNTPTICEGQTATLSATTSATSYTWNTGASTSSISITPTSTTVYTIDASDGSCIGSNTATVVVNALPALTASATPVCSGQTATLTANGAMSYTWIPGNLTGSSQTVSPTSTTIYTVSGTSADGCVNTSTIISTVSGPTANFSIDEGNVVTAGTTVHFTNTSTNATIYAWDLGLGNSIPVVSTNVTMSYADTGSYCVTLLATDGICNDTITKCLEVIKETSINVPNVFTPNGDNSNEFFKINGTSIKNFHCTIYDRWGLKLYEWDGINGYWDGNVKSGAAPNGTYFYIIDYTDIKDKSTTEKGFLSLFRE